MPKSQVLQLTTSNLGSIELQSRPERPHYRPDIDGLRAIAVISVVAFHAFPDLAPGGFVGVDIFFVISGFLISSIIFGGLAQNQFSFVDFYRRRIRRIFPSLVTVLIACFGFGWLALLPDEFKQLGKHIAGGAAFGSNFLLWDESGYFDKEASAKPLLHLWSLGIEEQFYVLFPLVLWFAWTRGFNLLNMGVLVAVTSFVLNLATVSIFPAAAFYLPYSRFWELMVGAGLAYVTLRPPARVESAWAHWRVPRGQGANASLGKFGNALSWLGVLLLGISAVEVTKLTRFPGYWALAPTLGTCFLIAAGPHGWINRKVLSNRALGWIGLISFPLYLWHWVLLSYAGILESGVPSLEIRVAAVLASVLLAWATFRFIETPLRFGKSGNTKALLLVVAMAMTGLAGYGVFAGDGIPSRYESLVANNAQFSWSNDLNSEARCVRRFGWDFRQYCLMSDPSLDPEIMLIGDSTANQLYYGLSTSLPKGRNLLMLGRGGCPPLLGVTTRLDDVDLRCEQVNDQWMRYATSTSSVKTVILAMMGAGYVTKRRSLMSTGSIELHRVGEEDEAPSHVVFEEALARTLRALTDAHKNVVFVVSTPRLDFSPTRCLDSRPFRLVDRPLMAPCGTSIAVFQRDNQEYRDAAFKVLKEFPKVRIFDPAATLCDQTYCYAMKEGRILYRDDVHLSTQGSVYLAKALLQLADDSALVASAKPLDLK
jgi:peptidoglycan/LPS O-acetylase OafA/YrhL